MTSDVEKAIRQLMQGLTSIAMQLEKAAGELRRYLEKGAKGGKPARAGKAKAARKPAARKAAKKSGAKKAAAKAADKKPAAKATGRKPAAKKSR